MAKFERRGAGMTERLVEIPETRQERLAAWARFDEQMPIAQPGDWTGDALRRANAERCREILARGGDLSSEGSAAWTAAHWLAEYNTFTKCRERIAKGDTSAACLSRFAGAAHEMGRWQSEMFWRSGVDYSTGISREALAIAGRSMKKGQKAAAESTNKAHAAMREARFARMAELIPALGVQNAARQCDAEGLGTWSAIERQWNRHKKPDT